jgi:hypothetical protein
MRFSVKFVLSLTLCCLPFAPAYAEASNPTTKALALAAIDQRKLSSAPGRLALVRAARDYCNDLGRAYPRNSPDEDAWLRQEIAGEGDRPERAIRSAELGRSMAANFVQSCIQGATAYETSPDKRGALLVMALAFARFRDAKYYGDKNGVDSDAFALDFLPIATVEALLTGALQERP